MVKNTNILLLKIGSKKIGLDLSEVKEVVKYQKLTPIPKASKTIAGILNLRGEIFSIFDLKYILTKEKTIPSEKESKFVITKYQELKAGYLIETLVDILEIPSSEIKKIKKQAKGKECFLGEIYYMKEIIPVLNIKNLLKIEVEELEKIDFLKFIE